jgi:hypothetical protein
MCEDKNKANERRNKEEDEVSEGGREGVNVPFFKRKGIAMSTDF